MADPLNDEERDALNKAIHDAPFDSMGGQYAYIFRAGIAHERARTGWQPIATAPKGLGEIVIVWESNARCSYFAFWDEGQWLEAFESPLIGDFTHWRELPAPPAADPERDEG